MSVDIVVVLCVCSSAVTRGERQTALACSRNMKATTASADVLSTVKPDDSSSLLSMSDHKPCPDVNVAEDSVSSEIPFTPPPRFKSVATQTLAAVEIPARTAGEIPAKVSTCVSGCSTSLSVMPDAAMTADIESVSADAEGTHSRLIACSNAVSSDYCLSLSTTRNVELPTTATRANDSYNSISPLNSMLPFSDDLDMASDRSAGDVADLFPANVDDDPPFIGFDMDPAYEHLSDLSGGKFLDFQNTEHDECSIQTLNYIDSHPPTPGEVFMTDKPCCSAMDSHPPTPGEVFMTDKPCCSAMAGLKTCRGKFHKHRSAWRTGLISRCGKFHSSTCIPRKSHGVFNNDVMLHCTSPQKLRSIRSQQTLDNITVPLQRSCCQRVVDEDIQFNLASPHKLRGIVASPHKQRVVDEDIQFNLASPHKQRGIVASPHKQHVVDEDIQFNLASPHKLRGIVASPHKQRVVDEDIQFNLASPHKLRGIVASPHKQRVVDEDIQFNLASPHKQRGIVASPHTLRGIVASPHKQRGIVASPHKQRVVDEDIQFNLASPHKQRGIVASPHKQRVVDEDIQFNLASPHKQRGIVASPHKLRGIVASPHKQRVVDEDIQFNLASPHKQRGIVFSEKSATPDCQVVALTASHKAGTQQRKRCLDLSENCQVPSSTSGQSVCAASQQSVDELRRCGRVKRRLMTKNCARDLKFC